MPRRGVALNAAFAERLRDIRRQKALSQDALARRADLSRTSITNIERSRQHVSLDVLYRLADALGVEPQELLPERTAVRERSDAAAVEGLRGLAEWDQRFVRVAVTKHR